MYFYLKYDEDGNKVWEPVEDGLVKTIGFLITSYNLYNNHFDNRPEYKERRLRRIGQTLFKVLHTNIVKDNQKEVINIPYTEDEVKRYWRVM